MNQQSPTDDLMKVPSPGRSKVMRRRVVVVGLIMAVLILGAAATIFLVADHRQAKRDAIQAQCGGPDAVAAYAALTSGDYDVLLTQAEAFKRSSTYVDSINCLYVAAEVDIAAGDVESAISHNDKLQALARQGRVLDKAYSNGGALVEATNDSVIFMRDYKMDTDSEGDPVEGGS